MFAISLPLFISFTEKEPFEPAGHVIAESDHGCVVQNIVFFTVIPVKTI